MTELEISAIKKLPEAYVSDGTQICLMEGDDLYVVVAHPSLPPMHFGSRKQEWVELGTSVAPANFSTAANYCNAQ